MHRPIKFKALIRVFSSFIFVGLCVLFIVPTPKFSEQYATLLLSEEGDFLNAHVSKDEQWRFEPMDSIPENFKHALLMFEDQHFFTHFGVNPISIIRAFKQNIKSKRVVSGGSTITMQLARLSRPGEPRTIWQKCIEIAMALKIELLKSKSEILNLYVTNAPFGGNTVGLEAASWRYFKRSPHNLSWAESATLAVLPNAPSLIYPGKNSILLKKKRNRLLTKLYNKGLLDETNYSLSLLEPLPKPPKEVPSVAAHLLERLRQERGSKRYETTISSPLQQKVNQIISEFKSNYSLQGINNMAALVIDLNQNSVKAYIGNCGDPNRKNGGDVDIIQAPRSSGSILKPFLYAAAISDGTILPNMLMEDIPTYFNGFTPQNFNKQFDGLVPANEALVRSLNIPFVLLLKEYGTPRFYNVLNRLSFKSFNQSPDHYGLSMILGGGEVTLWELASAYGSMANTLNLQKKSFEIIDPIILRNQTQTPKHNVAAITTGSIWITLNNLTNLKRPDEESGWHYFNSSKKIAWKTGTSFGFRDAWAVGLTANYLVATWVGNADGQGVPGLTGTSKAAPIMFQIFKQLTSSSSFFSPPWDNLSYYPVCKKSGFLASPHCESIDTIIIPSSSKSNVLCPYHKTVHLSKDETYRVNSDCYDPNLMIHKKWFVLPLKCKTYWQKGHSDYKELPPFMANCYQEKRIGFTYPDQNLKLYLPIDFDGNKNPIVCEANNDDPKAVIRWFVDEFYVGSTQNKHQIPLIIPKGTHTITICDLDGNEDKVTIEVLEATR